MASQALGSFLTDGNVLIAELLGAIGLGIFAVASVIVDRIQQRHRRREAIRRGLDQIDSLPDRDCES